jgi:glycosyltransferase involved in cell wall biosynthesis
MHHCPRCTADVLERSGAPGRIADKATLTLLAGARWWYPSPRPRDAVLPQITGGPRRAETTGVMRITQIHTTYLLPGGEDGVVRREKDLLQQHDHEVDTIEFANPSSTTEQILKLGASTWNVRSAAMTRRRVEATRPDVVHAHNTWYSASTSVLKAAHDVAPVVLTLHNYRLLCLNGYLFRDGAICTDCVGGTLLRGVVRKCYRESRAQSAAMAVATTTARDLGLIRRYVDQLLVLSDFAADLLSGLGEKIPQIVRHDNFVPDPGQRIAAASDSAAVLAIGRLSPEKGFDQLIETWKVAAPRGLELLIVGSGPQREELEAFAEGSTIRFVGQQTPEEVRGLMLSSRALLFPSAWFEGQPLVLLEALAAGLPIVSSAQPPVNEIIEGVGISANDRAQWLSALDALADTVWLKEASRASRSRFDERYTPDIAAERLARIYSAL